ncbi:hypothetical protein ABTM00_20090, partial [Acinetobacter baumannii]
MAAMQAGAPIITTKGDMTDTIFFEDGVNCIFLKCTNTSSIKESLMRLLNTRELRLQLKNNAIQTYQSMACWNKHV